MEKDNYEIGQNNQQARPPRRGPGRGQVHGENCLLIVKNIGAL